MSFVSKKFDSSLIKEGRYNVRDSELYITFPNGKEYLYLSVPVEEWDELTRSASAGQYFTKNIKGKYAYRIIKS